MEKHQELIVIIKSKKLDRVKNKKSPYWGNQYWRLKVKSEEEEREILVFKEYLKRGEIWQKVEQWELKKDWKKQYLFTIQRKPGAGRIYRLIDWEILSQLSKNHGSQQ